jgi:ankyrin repeat protein
VLLDGGADASIRDHNYSSTPLGWANESGQTELMDLILLRHQPDVVDAAWLGDADRVRVLLARDASLVDGLDGGKVSPLRSAAWCGHLDVVRVLLEYGADATMPNPENGKTALDFARERGHEEIVALLRPDGDSMRFQRFEPRPGSNRS